MQMTEASHPAITLEAAADTKKTRCRIGWKSLLTGFQSHGSWYDMDEEDMLKKLVAEMNTRYSGALHHWLEYK